MTDGGELIPLRTGFDVVLRGYRRRQVREYVRAVEEELRLVAADRDANAELADTLTTEVEHLRAENARLAHRLDEVCRTPVEPDAVPARLRRMVELAQEEATEITARAQAAAEHSWAAAEDAARRLRARYEGTLTEMDRERKEMQAQHRALLQQARVDAAVMTTEADRRRTELDEQAARRRARVEADFEVAMVRRRSEAMREIAERQQAARAEAKRLVAESKKDADRRVRVATEDATRLVDTAKAEVARYGTCAAGSPRSCAARRKYWSVWDRCCHRPPARETCSRSPPDRAYPNPARPAEVSTRHEQPPTISENGALTGIAPR